MLRKPLVMALLILASCGRGGSDERDRAAGQILSGSASDAMLQTDRLQAEAPLAKPEAAAKLANKGKPGGPAAATPEEGEAPAAPAIETTPPAATPTPEAAPPPTP